MHCMPPSLFFKKNNTLSNITWLSAIIITEKQGRSFFSSKIKISIYFLPKIHKNKIIS